MNKDLCGLSLSVGWDRCSRVKVKLANVAPALLLTT